jgi:hypothetical protein
MSEITAEKVRIYWSINIASYATNVPGLIIWICVLARILTNDAKLWGLVLICSLMIVCQIAIIIMNQMTYTMVLKQYEGDDINLIFYTQSADATWFLNIATFNLAHWLFAFNYWALSWRIELIKNQISPDIYNSRLNTLNIAVSMINVLMPAIDWIYWN